MVGSDLAEQPRRETEELMSKLITASITLSLCLMLGNTAGAESMPDQPPPPKACKCNDDCKNDYYGRHFCYIYSSAGDGWCDYSGPGKPCPKEAGTDIPPLPEPPSKEQGVGLEPASKEQWIGLEPGYPESDPWYEDMKGVNPSPDGGPPIALDGDDNELTDRGGCSVHCGAGAAWPLGLLIIAALLVRRRRY